MVIIDKIKRVGHIAYIVYFDVGAISMGILAFMVFFTVIMRYFFSLNWKEVSEFNTTLFAFTTFWCMGLNILRDEHVKIDILYDKIPPRFKRWVGVLDYIIVLMIDIIFTYKGIQYVAMAGKQISFGMEIPMYYMYGIMPLCGAICLICVIIKIVQYILAPIEFFTPAKTRLKDKKAECNRKEVN